MGNTPPPKDSYSFDDIKIAAQMAGVSVAEMQREIAKGYKPTR